MSQGKTWRKGLQIKRDQFDVWPCMYADRLTLYNSIYFDNYIYIYIEIWIFSLILKNHNYFVHGLLTFYRFLLTLIIIY